VPDFCVELHFGRNVRVFVGDLDVDLEQTALVNRVGRAAHHGLPVSEVVVDQPYLELLLIK
jgi:hypothetical protein